MPEGLSFIIKDPKRREPHNIAINGKGTRFGRLDMLSIKTSCIIIT
jgi:hypothetical protein